MLFLGVHWKGKETIVKPTVKKAFGMVILVAIATVIIATVVVNGAVPAFKLTRPQNSAAEESIADHPYQEPIANLIRVYNPNIPQEDMEEIILAILEASETYEVDARLLTALIAVESGFQRHAVSSRGARGLTQITPDKCVEKDWRDIRVNVSIGTAYLKQQVNSFGTLSQALAAYNAGPGRARKGPEYYPRETRLYIKRVLRIYEQLLQNTDETKRPS